MRVALFVVVALAVAVIAAPAEEAKKPRARKGVQRHRAGAGKPRGGPRRAKAAAAAPAAAPEAADAAPAAAEGGDAPAAPVADDAADD
ncbi:hypothetical protein HGRIS_013733 [Hohenbuehelia grisea]|uniref:Uncharacterized protein n=1 Tax=Hohenbuehelia grisea TaxID=104357 RepID=A0ABR3IWG9_9AGAR